MRGLPVRSAPRVISVRLIDGVADQVDHRVAEPLDDRAVERGSCPTIRSSISLPKRSARSRTTRGNREKSSSTGTIRRSSVVSRICRLMRFQGLERVDPGGGPVDLAEPLEVVGEHCQLAGQSDEVVELGGVDPDPGVRPGTRKRRKPAHLGARA